MPTLQAQSEFAAFAVELLQSVGPAEARRMFGGYGIFIDGLMFALIADNRLYLKVDDETLDDYRALGLEPFTYVRKGKQLSLSYYAAPGEAMESSDDMRRWGTRAYAAALRAAPAARKRKPRRTARPAARQRRH